MASIKSRKPKPPTRMQLSVTVYFPADVTEDQEVAAALEFLKLVALVPNRAWVRLRGLNVPPSVEDAFATCKDRGKPNLTVIVNNDTSKSQAGN